jgi:hypothetical protein
MQRHAFNAENGLFVSLSASNDQSIPLYDA